MIVTIIITLLFLDFLLISLNKHTQFINNEKKGYLPFEIRTNFAINDTDYYNKVFIFNESEERDY